MTVLKRLWTSDVLFGTATVNGWILTAGMCQILITVMVCGLASVPFWLNWWLLCDSVRVFISICQRMDYLLREQLEGQETYLERLRLSLAVVNMIGLLLGVCVLAYKPMWAGQPVELFVLTIIVLSLHVVTSLPAISYLIRGRDVLRDTHEEPEGEESDQSRAPLLGRGNREDEETNANPSEEITVATDYTRPFPQTLPPQLSRDSNQCVLPAQRDTSCPLSGILPVGGIQMQSRILKENVLANARQRARVAIMQQQDVDYDIMISEHRKCEEKQHECGNGSETVLEPIELRQSVLPAEPDENDEFAVEMRFLAPNGTQVTRRFSRTSTLNIVLRWVERTLRESNIAYNKGFCICERYPRKVYDKSQYDLTLEELMFWRSGRQAPQRSSVLILELL